MKEAAIPIGEVDYRSLRCFDNIYSLRLLHDIRNAPAHLGPVNKKDEEKDTLKVDAEDPIYKENIIMSPVQLFTLAVATEEAERRYKESMIISSIPTYYPIFPLFHYQSFGINYDGLMVHLRRTDCKYKRVPCIEIGYDGLMASSFNVVVRLRRTLLYFYFLLSLERRK